MRAKRYILPAAMTLMLSLVMGAATASPNEGPEDDNDEAEHLELFDDLRNKLNAQVFKAADGHIEIVLPDGRRLSYNLTKTTASTAAACQNANPVCLQPLDGDDLYEIHYASNKTELAHPESHDRSSLEHYAAQNNFRVIATAPDGTMTVLNTVTGQTFTVRLDPNVESAASELAEGLHIDNDGQVIVVYPDQTAQRIRVL